MKNIFLALAFLLITKSGFSQNLILNPDFELYTGCPTNYAQVDSAINWVSVVQTADYYNCGFLVGAYISDPIAYSGTGFMGFANYGNTGFSESVGQFLSVPFLPSQSYSISVAAKKPYAGQGVDTCGGVALYGFKSNMPIDSVSIHLSQLPNSILLGVSSIVQDTAWQLYSFTFTPIDTINSIAFTVEYSLNCYQCIFIDYVNIQATSTSLNDFNNVPQFSVGPNPFDETISIVTDEKEQCQIIIYDINSRKRFEESFTHATTISVPLLSSGIYIYEIRNEQEVLSKGKLFKR